MEEATLSPGPFLVAEEKTSFRHASLPRSARPGSQVITRDVSGTRKPKLARLRVCGDSRTQGRREVHRVLWHHDGDSAVATHAALTMRSGAPVGRPRQTKASLVFHGLPRKVHCASDSQGLTQNSPRAFLQDVPSFCFEPSSDRVAFSAEVVAPCLPCGLMEGGRNQPRRWDAERKDGGWKCESW